MLKAILFDLDGVLIETELETFNFYQRELKNYNIHLKDSDFKYKAGRKSVDFWNAVLNEEQKKIVNTEKLTGLKRRVFNKYPSKYIKKVPGGKKLLQKLKKAGFKLALASQNEPEMVKTAIKWLGIEKIFDATLSLQDIKHKKPNPEIYLLAAKMLKIKPEQCLVVEDSRDGVEAARNAKMLCIAIKHPYTPKGALAKASGQIKLLTELNLDRIKIFNNF